MSFFIDVDAGRVATRSQLIEAGLSDEREPPEAPWHPVRGDDDASTLFHAVMRKRVAGRQREIWIGTLCIRHSDHHASLQADGWQEVDIDEIRAFEN